MMAYNSLLKLSYCLKARIFLISDRYLINLKCINLKWYLERAQHWTVIVTTMSLSVSEFTELLVDRWEESILPMSVEEVKEYRQIRLKELDGQIMPPISTWPENIQNIIDCNKIPPGYKNTYKLFVFLIGNGCSPFKAGTWIISYFGLSLWKKRFYC